MYLRGNATDYSLEKYVGSNPSGELFVFHLNHSNPSHLISFSPVIFAFTIEFDFDLQLFNFHALSRLLTSFFEMENVMGLSHFHPLSVQLSAFLSATLSPIPGAEEYA